MAHSITRSYILGKGWRYVATVDGRTLPPYGTRRQAALAVGRYKAAKARDTIAAAFLPRPARPVLTLGA